MFNGISNTMLQLKLHSSNSRLPLVLRVLLHLHHLVKLHHHPPAPAHHLLVGPLVPAVTML